MGSDAEIVSLCAFCGADDHQIADCDEAHEQRVRDAVRRAEEAADEAITAARLQEYEEELAEAAAEAAVDDHLGLEEGNDVGEADNDDAEAPRVKQRTVAPNEFDRGDQTEIGLRLIEKLTGKGEPVVYDDGALYRYEPKDGLWRPIDDDTQSKMIQDFAGSALANERKKTLRIGHSDVRGAIRLAASRARRNGFFLATPNTHGIVFSNGFVVVSADGIKVQEHSPANRARWGYSFGHVEDPKPTAFLNFLNAIFRDDADKEQKIAFVQEFGGLALLGLAPLFSHCLVATSFVDASSDGSNGKSQLATVFMSIMPSGTVVCTRPQDFESEYRRAGLAGKLLNCVGEMPEGDILDSASFKAIVTGDEIEGRPIREAPFKFTPRAAHYYACNQPPGTGDFTRAFFRRFVFLVFNRVFRDTDPDFVLDIGRTIVNKEREILPSWFLQGAVRALKQKRYTHVPSSDVAISKWREKIDQVALFMNETTVSVKSDSPGKKSDWTEASSLYRRYKEWVDDTGHKRLASNTFGTRMKQLGKAPSKINSGWFYPVKLV